MPAEAQQSLSGDTPQERCRILVLGVGGGGCNAVSHMREGWVDGPACFVLDTDIQALNTRENVTALPLGHVVTQGQGAGGDPTVGRIAAEEDRDLLVDRFREYDILFLNVALGGGTGTGAAPVIVQAAREAGALVLCFASMPFHFEGEDRLQCSKLGLRELRNHADAVIVQENDRLLELASPAEALASSFVAADTLLGVALRSMWRILAQPGVMNVNFSDLRRLIETSGGTCALGVGCGGGDKRVDEAIEELLQNPMLDRGAVLAKSASLLVNITAGAEISLQEVERVMNQIKALSQPEARIAMGVAVDPILSDHLMITTLAAEQWVLPEVSVEESESEPGNTPDQGPSVSHGGGGGKRGSKPNEQRKRVQAKMSFKAGGKDRFDGVAPSLYEGQDLDVPTFVRKGIRLSRDRVPPSG